MEGILEHFVHMVLCKCAVVLIKAESMKPSLSDAVWQGENAETVVAKGNTFPNKDFLKKPTTKIHPKTKLGKIVRDVFSTVPQSLVPPIDFIDENVCLKKKNPLKQI